MSELGSADLRLALAEWTLAAVRLLSTREAKGKPRWRQGASEGLWEERLIIDYDLSVYLASEPLFGMEQTAAVVDTVASRPRLTHAFLGPPWPDAGDDRVPAARRIFGYSRGAGIYSLAGGCASPDPTEEGGTATNAWGTARSYGRLDPPDASQAGRRVAISAGVGEFVATTVSISPSRASASSKESSYRPESGAPYFAIFATLSIASA